MAGRGELATLTGEASPLLTTSTEAERCPTKSTLASRKGLYLTQLKYLSSMPKKNWRQITCALGG